jgi:hypothetical protein
MVEAMRSWTEVRKNAYQALLQESEARLAPFGEPLRVDFGTHGWLSDEREESFTAWLGWIIDQIREPDLIFRLLGIEDDAAVSAARGAVFRPPDREVPILDNTRRLDLVIRYEGVVLIVVEVKVTGADSAQTAKQAEYFGWMTGQPEQFKRAVLLATDASEEEYDKFRFVSWGHVCAELRRLASRYRLTRPTVAAMILAFVSAVERNLLQMSLPESDAPAISWMAQSAVFEHIEKSIERSATVTTTISPTAAPTLGGSEKFIEEGAVSYVQATIAISEFARIVQEECEKLALKRLDDIKRIMGTEITEDSLRNDPVSGKMLDPSDPWLCTWFPVKDARYVCFGLYWQPLREGGYKLHAVALIEFSDRRLYERARDKFRGAKDSRIGAFPYKDQDRCLTLLEPIPGGQAASFPLIVDSVLSGFLEEWESIGGLEGLKSPAVST